MGDMNWFFSACAQTAGAIVAIVGGFLATRLINISTERNGAQQALILAKRRLGNARARKRDAERELRDWETMEFRGSVLYDMVGAEERWTPEVLMQRYAGVLLSEDDLHGVMKEIAESAAKAFDAFKSFDDDVIAELEFEEAAARLPVPPSLLERDVFEATFTKLRDGARSRIQALDSALAFRFDWFSTPFVPIRDFVAQGNERAGLHERHIQAKIEVDRAESDIDALETQVARIQRPTGLLPAWIILAYLSVVGVAVPLALLPTAESAVKWKIPVLVLFLAGLAALLGYFFRMGLEAISRSKRRRS
jgi:hypothetical protein